MTNSLVDDLLGQLQGNSMGAMAQQLGADTATTSTAVATALPMLLGALGKNAQQPGGAEALFGALQRDHAGQGAMNLGDLLGGAGGGLGGLLGSVLGGAGAAPGTNPQLDAGGILGHVFGANQSRAQAGLGQATGLNGGQSAKLLMMLAPIVMGFLAKRANAGGLDASGLGQALGQERNRIQQQGGAAGGLLTAVLDQNGDGKLDMGDLLQLGSKFLAGRR